jgi:hypothetical protein
MSHEQLQELLGLPLAERIGLAQALWQSIHESADDDPDGDEGRQAVEQARARDAEMTSGAAVGRTHEEVMKAARRALQCD